MAPVVSVIMANYNTPIEYLKEAIDSILFQTFTDFELIIVDDKSTDSSIEYIKSIQDKRIVLIQNEKNSGPAISRNNALDIAKGKYVAIMDSDDISLPDRLQTEVDFMDNNPDLIACGSWFEKFGIENKTRQPVIDNYEYYRCQLLFNNTPITLCHSTAMIRKSMIDEYNIRYSEALPKAQDYGLWTVCSEFGRIDIIKKVLLKYRTHSSQISTLTYDAQAKCADSVSAYNLSKLGVDCNERHFEWRHAITNSVEDFVLFSKWLYTIEEKNNAKNRYNTIVLSDYIDYLLCRAIKNRRDETISIFIQGDFRIKKLIIKMFMNRKK